MRSCYVTVQVPFHDVDAMQVVWHGHYVRYFEVARCALLESFGYNYQQMKDSGYAWPVFDLQARFIRPARFGQTLRVSATLVDWENRLKIKYVIEDASGERLSTGSTSQVAVDLKTGEMCFASPPVVFEKLGLPVP